jgi:hypothetical protein
MEKQTSPAFLSGTDRKFTNVLTPSRRLWLMGVRIMTFRRLKIDGISLWRWGAKVGGNMTVATGIHTQPRWRQPGSINCWLACRTDAALCYDRIVRGMEEWAQLPANIWFHLVTIILALLLPIMLLRFVPR